MNRLVWCLLLLSCLTGCRGDRDTYAASDHSSPDDYVLAGHTDGAPAKCDSEAVAGRVVALFTALNAGESGIAQRFFGLGTEAPFKWFSFTYPDSAGSGHFVAYSAAELDAHFARRYSAGDQFSLRGIDFIGWEESRGTVALSPLFFEYVTRSATTDEYVTHRGFGKGEYHCATSAFIVMSVGTMDDDRWNSLYEVHLADPSTPNGR